MPRKTRVREHSRSNASRVREHERVISDDPRDMLIQNAIIEAKYREPEFGPEWESNYPNGSFLAQDDDFEEGVKYVAVLKNDATPNGLNLVMLYGYDDGDWLLHVEELDDPEGDSSALYNATYGSHSEAMAAWKSGSFWRDAEEVGGS